MLNKYIKIKNLKSYNFYNKELIDNNENFTITIKDYKYYKCYNGVIDEDSGTTIPNAIPIKYEGKYVYKLYSGPQIAGVDTPKPIYVSLNAFQNIMFFIIQNNFIEIVSKSFDKILSIFKIAL